MLQGYVNISDLKNKYLENECTMFAAFVAAASDDDRICKDNYLCATKNVWNQTTIS